MPTLIRRARIFTATHRSQTARTNPRYGDCGTCGQRSWSLTFRRDIRRFVCPACR